MKFMTHSRRLSIDDWLSERSRGAIEVGRCFTVHSARAERLGGYPPLQLCDVPLLLLAAAVEGGARWFRIHGRQNCLFSWDAPAGPTLGKALSVLSSENVDYRCDGKHHCEVPEAFRDLLSPFFQRTTHAPLSVVLDDRLLRSNPAGGIVWSKPSTHPAMTLVDRGVSFEMPFALPGLQVVARVRPLNGAPWPIQLAWDNVLQDCVRNLIELPHTF